MVQTQLGQGRRRAGVGGRFLGAHRQQRFVKRYAFSKQLGGSVSDPPIAKVDAGRAQAVLARFGSSIVTGLLE